MNREEEDALVRELESLKDTGRELDGYERVNARIAKNPGAVVSMRMKSADLQEIIDAARVLHLNTSEFIREAALRQAREVQAGIDRAKETILARGT